MIDFKEKYAEYARGFEAALGDYCAKMDFAPSVLTESMRYSLQIGGKRVRPVLFLAAVDLLGGDWKRETDYAIALEMIHTYSLIHDDLPAMDNDDYRRGKPSNHKMFGEANAILAGDALLNTAFSLLLAQISRGTEHLYAARCLCDAAGAGGMIAGQSADLLYTSAEQVTPEELEFIYEHKTGKLITAPLVMAAILSGSYYFEMKQFGHDLGILFQITDDILDEVGSFDKMGKTLGKDKASGKLTCVKVYGLSAAQLQADLYAEKCHRVLEAIDKDVSFFHALTDYVRNRNQ